MIGRDRLPYTLYFVCDRSTACTLCYDYIGGRENKGEENKLDGEKTRICVHVLRGGGFLLNQSSTPEC